MKSGPAPASSQLGQFARFALVIFVAACALLILVDPVKYTDTDCWIHLSGGKYFFEHGTFPRDSYFSFLEPPRPWLSYAWAFQALIYVIFSGSGYYGLLLLRTVIYLALAVLVLRFLFQRVNGDRAPMGWLAFVGMLVFMVLLPRYLNIRPHMFTYLLTMLFLWILEFRPRQAVWLVPLGIVWCNFHGVSFPVMILITGAYALEYLVRRFRVGSHDPVEERRVFVPMVLSMATVYMTPLGAQLIQAPGRSLDYLAHFVNELVPLSVTEMTSLDVILFQPSYNSCVNVLVLAAILAAVTSIVHRQVRISHLVLFLGGCYLLYRGRRFAYEFALLSLPLLRANPVVVSLGQTRVFASKVATWVLTFVLLLMPVAFLVGFAKGRGAYPFTPTGLPVGVCAFLNRVEAGGNVLNAPNSGGYLRWQLYPKYKILMDMDSYFEDSDFYMARKLLNEPHLLKQMLDRYDPSFISVPLYLKNFQEAMHEFPDYRPVFFDDAEVLYANRRLYPALAEAYELRALEPGNVFTLPMTEIVENDGALEAYGREAHRMLAIYPDAGNLNHLMGLIYLKEHRYDRALEHAEALVKTFPEFGHGYLLKGDALDGLGDSNGALAAYAASVRKPGSDWEAAYKQMGEVYLDRREYDKAYRHYVKGIEPLRETVTTDDLYALAWAALQSKRMKEANALFTFMLEFKLPPEDTEWREKIHGVMKQYGLEASQDG